VLVLAAALGWVVWRRRKYPWLATGAAWYLVMLLPVAGLVQVGQQGMADRYTYLPTIGVLVALAWAPRGLPAVSRPARAALLGAAVGYLLLLAILTPRQVARWHDARALFTHAVALDADNWLAHLKLAETAFAVDRLTEARSGLERSLALAPRNLHARTLLGVTLEKLGRPREARRVLEEAVRLDPTWVDARHNLALVQANFGRTAEAMAHLRRELLFDPESVRARRVLATLLLESGSLLESEALIRERQALRPGDPATLALQERLDRARGFSPGR
jgi:tetratricopeptide (TPR) repeat protein